MVKHIYRWSTERLARHYRIREERVIAIITLKQREQEARERVCVGCVCVFACFCNAHHYHPPPHYQTIYLYNNATMYQYNHVPIHPCTNTPMYQYTYTHHTPTPTIPPPLPHHTHDTPTPTTHYHVPHIPPQQGELLMDDLADFMENEVYGCKYRRGTGERHIVKLPVAPRFVVWILYGGMWVVWWNVGCMVECGLYGGMWVVG